MIRRNSAVGAASRYSKDFASGRNRWGDDSQTMVDPTGDASFWTIQEYARAQAPRTVGGSTGKWGTCWIKVNRLSGSFTDDPLSTGSTVIRAVHVTELRSHIDTQRIRFGLAAYPWTDPTLTAGTTQVGAVHVTDLRLALAQAYTAASLTPPAYSTDPILSAGTSIKALHLSEIRAAVVAIE